LQVPTGSVSTVGPVARDATKQPVIIRRSERFTAREVIRIM